MAQQAKKDVLAGIKGSKAPKGAPRRKRRGGNMGITKGHNSRPRYWASNRLRQRKVRNLMRHCGMTRAEAEKRWDATRTRLGPRAAPSAWGQAA